MNIKKLSTRSYLNTITPSLITIPIFIIIVTFTMPTSSAQVNVGDSLLGKAVFFQQPDNFNGDSVKSYSAKAAVAYRRDGASFLGWLKSQSKISYILQWEEAYNENIIHINTVIKQFWQRPQTPEEKRAIIFIYLRQGFNYYNLGNHIKAIEFYNQAHTRIPKSCSIEDKSDKNRKDDCLDYYYESQSILYPLNLSYLKIGDYNTILKRIPDTFLTNWEQNINDKIEYDHLSQLYSLKGQAYLKLSRSKQDTIIASTYLRKASTLPNLTKEQQIRAAINYGRVLHNVDQATEGINIIKEAVKTLNSTKLQGKVKNEILSKAYLYLGYLYRAEKAYELSTKYADTASQILSINTPSLKSRAFSKIYMLKAELLHKQNQYFASNTYYQKALDCIIPDYNEGDPVYEFDKEKVIPDFDLLHIFKYVGDNWKAEYQGDSGGKQNHLQHALSCYRLAIYTEDSLKAHYQLETTRLEMSRKRVPYLGSAIDAAHQLWQVAQKRRYLDEALFFFEKSQAQELQMNLAANRLMNTDSTMNALYQTKLSTWAQKTQKQSDYDSIQQLNTKDLVQLDTLSTQINRLNHKYRQLHQQLQDYFKSSYGTAWLSSTKTIDLEVLNRKLNGQEAIVSFFESPNDSLMFILYITSSAMELKRIQLNANLCSKIDTVKQFLRTEHPDIDARRAYQRLAYELYDLFLSPIHELSINKLIVVPSTRLHDFPLEILITEKPKSPKALPYRKLSFLWQKFPIRYLEAASLLEQPTPKRHKPQLDYLGFAPDYSLGDSGQQLTSSRNISLLLNHNQEEVSRTAEKFSDPNRYNIFIEDRAMESSFMRLAPEAEILHLSMHADTHTNDFLYSYLQFLEPQEDSLSKASDGKLFMHEIYNLPLNADLTILSACETGLGKALLGEGIMSLGRAFQFAGSKNILISLWKVDDYSSSKLVPIFMKYIQAGYSKDEALQQARLEFVFDEEKGNSDLSPYYWAQFVLYGDSLPVPSTKKFPLEGWILFSLAGIFLIGIGIRGFNARNN